MYRYPLPSSRRCRGYGPVPDYVFFFLAIIQRHSGCAFLVGVGEVAVQCDFREYLACFSLYRFPHLLTPFLYAQTVRFTPVVLGLVISFASDTRYSLNDVRETLPGYLALMSYILLTGASEHLRSMLAPSVGAKYVSVCYTVGAAAFSLIVYVARDVFVSIPQASSVLASCTTS